MTLPFPFTVSCDIDLSSQVTFPFIREGADVSIAEGEVPATLLESPAQSPYEIVDGQFLHRLPDGSRILVRNGTEITYSRGSLTTDRDLLLALTGPAWSALCYQRGLIPLHASANTFGQRVVAFAGHSGAGKSTLAAELAARGHRFFTDDTLIFPATSSEENLLCYPGQRRLRLWRDALDRMGLPVGEAVRDNRNTNKHYADAENRAPVSMAPLGTLVILRKAEEKQAAPNSWRTLSGPEAVLAVAERLSKPQCAEELLGRERLFFALGRLLEKVTVCEFTTRRREDDPDAAIEFVLNHVHEGQSNQSPEDD